LISAFAVAHKIPLMVKDDCSGIVSRVAGLFHRRGFKGAYGLLSIGYEKILLKTDLNLRGDYKLSYVA
jgi:acetolactate synthase small subunit